MNLSQWLESSSQFCKLLTALVSETMQNPVDSLSLDDPVLSQFALTQWAQHRLPDEPSALAVVSLLIAYHFRCLLVDAIRPENSLQEEVNATLLLPLYIWPMYRIWILQEFPPKSRLSQVDAVRFLLDAGQRRTAFMELKITEPDGKLLSYLELKQNTTNLSRWIRDGFDRLYHAIHLTVFQTLPAPIRQPENGKKTNIPIPEKTLDKSNEPQKNGISRLGENTQGDRWEPFSENDMGFPNSPIFQPYLNCSEVSSTWQALQRQNRETPSLIHVARAIIDRRIQAAHLELGQQALALELLSDLTEWISCDDASGQSISLKGIELRWKQFHSSDPSPLIHALLASNLLQIASQDGQVRFTDPLIYDFFASLDHVKRLHSTNPAPPSGQGFSTWLYWLVVQWLEYGDTQNAGILLLYAGGTLPGYRSGTWLPLAELLKIFPHLAQTNCHIELLDKIAQDVNNLNGNRNNGYANWLSQGYSSSRPSLPITTDPQGDMDIVYKSYKDGLEQYLVASKGDSGLTLEIALGFDQTSRNNPWYRKHAWANLRDRDPKEEVEIGWLPFIYKRQPLQEIIFNHARKESNWDMKLAAVELLAVWKTQEAKSLITDHEIKDLPTEYYHRARILRCALEGKMGYQEWI